MEARPERYSPTHAIPDYAHLDALESQSIFILREAFSQVERLATLWSVGKDSSVLLWLIRKAFFGQVPVPCIHIDTTYKIPEMIAFRDALAREWGLELVVGKNERALAAGTTFPQGMADRVQCCSLLKRDGLQQLVDQHGYEALILGIRRDEEGTRAKERYFSPRNNQFQWEFKNQPPEIWDQYKTSFEPGTHLRIHPLLHWTEVNIWEYIDRERIPVVDLYFAREGYRYRSLGCAPCTNRIASSARNVPEIIDELRSTRVSERSTRAQDQESEDAFERLRESGYM